MMLKLVSLVSTPETWLALLAKTAATVAFAAGAALDGCFAFSLADAFGSTCAKGQSEPGLQVPFE